MTQNEKIVRHLKRGRTLSSRQAREQYNITNLRARVVELREQGYCIYTRDHSRQSAHYFIASAPLEVVSTAYRAVGGELFVL